VNLQEIVEDLPPTALSYQANPYSSSAPGTVLRAVKEQGSNYYVVLSSTIFHPKGGGQPSDTGSLKGQGFSMQVKKALKSGDHVVLYGKCSGAPSEGPCTQEIDWEKRLLYMRRHAAAHLFDGVLARVSGRAFEPLDSWLGDDAYVAYQGDPPGDDTVMRAEKEANREIADGRVVRVEVVKPEDLSGVRHFWSSVLQDQKEIRLVTVEGFEAIPCAGTHVRDIKEIVGVKVISTESTPDGFRIHFDVVTPA
jgi:alanyl-tRNA synthetase